jgi:phenylalanyl-tRNA synthetase beta chain
VKVLLSWIREFVEVNQPAEDIGKLMGVRGLPLEGLEMITGKPEGLPPQPDAVMDFEVYANRPDTLSMLGIAREIATAYGLPLKAGAFAFAPGASADKKVSSLQIPVVIADPDLCGRYVGALADVTVGPSPQWMQDRLAACGVRPISNIVDITNYVLLELGQPMHAFDLATLAGGVITVRRAKPGEALKTLDGKMRTLTPDMLVIADAERAQAIGGVMGGADSEVTSKTTQIVFEAAWFNPASVRATSKKLGLKTEASTRFERGADLTLPALAMARACALLEEIGAGKATGLVTDAYPVHHTPKQLRLDRARIAGLLGMDVPDVDVIRILEALGFEATTVVSQPAPHKGVPYVPAEAWDVTVPSWRVDIHRQVDLIEEVGRHYGFEHLPSTFPGVQQAPPPSDPRIARDARVRSAMLGMGFSEGISFGFIEEVAAAPFLTPSTTVGANGQPPVALINPLSEKFAVMRPSLLPGLIDAVSHNRRHGRRDVRLFEIGTRFSQSGETRGLGMAWTGLATSDHWSGARRDVDFWDLKGVVEQLAAQGVAHASFSEATSAYLSDGRAANLVVNGEAIGIFGQLAASVADARGLPPGDAVFVAEINLDALTAAAPADTLRTTSLPKYPSVVRDVSILVDDALSAETVRGTIRSAAPDTLVLIREFDRYQGKGVPDGKVSLSLRLTFQSPERTLTDDEVQVGMQKIIDALIKNLSAVQR